MPPADELFADGKLVPLQLSSFWHSAFSEARSPDTPKYRRRNEISSRDPNLFSTEAPRCSSRWKELIGLKNLYQNSSMKQEDPRMASSESSNNNKNSSRGLKHMLQRSSKSSMNTSLNSSLNQPLLKDSDNESISSSSSHEHHDLPRLSLDSEKPSSGIRNAHQSTSRNLSRVRLSKYKSENRVRICFA
ncbi:hypothetical protein SASPL_121097 [Salvia splendens]|uniref:Uncharacterized protein n=2 Tax=Salvia splendens TaxID=180675 RepID=A0A8X8XWP5_SALSN|nr:hypothetical protein SASPL_121097 [Salvia splendens]